jgi:hypothetical protein
MNHKTFSLCALFPLVALVCSCSKTAPTPEKDTASTPSALVVVPSASAALAEREPPKKELPLLVFEPFEATKGKNIDFYAIEGALMVVDDLRVGRIVDEKIEWIGSIPKGYPSLGGNRVASVEGFWPDEVNVYFTSNNGRALEPTYFPMTGKGVTLEVGGGNSAWVYGSARVGQTTIIAGDSTFGGHVLETMRGPKFMIQPLTPEKGGCTEDDIKKYLPQHQNGAVDYHAISATEKGTLVTIGNLCRRDNSPAAEVWDLPGKSRIVELGSMIKHLDYFPKFLRGKGDDLWIDSTPILHYNGGKFETLPALDKPIRNLFVSPDGKLHATSGRAIVRFDAGEWKPIANLPWPTKFRTIAMDDKGTFWVSYGGVSRLREAKGSEVAEGCKTPFVYLYDVSWRNDAKYNFPTTRKALSTFPAASKISLVEYYEEGRRLGITVEDEAQGAAVVAHIQANMKDEHPEVICYAPKKPRRIDLEGK